MNFNRRDFARLFGAGALVAPVIGGEAVEAATARLTAPARVVLPTDEDVAALATGGPLFGTAIRIDVGHGKDRVVIATRAVGFKWLPGPDVISLYKQHGYREQTFGPDMEVSFTGVIKQGFAKIT